MGMVDENETGIAEPGEFRRFFYVAEEKFSVAGGRGTVVAGKVHGRIDLDDEIYILQPSGAVLRSTVKGMDTKIESYMMKIQTATDMPVNLFMEIKFDNFEKYSVITSVKPQFQPGENTAVENPALSALLYETRTLSGREEYYNWLCYSIVHGKYLTPIRTRQPAGGHRRSAGSAQQAEVAYNMLPSPRAGEEGIFLLPVFTDWQELNRWENLMQSGEVQTTVLSFQDILPITKWNNCNGFVINPFSRNQMIVDNRLIEALTTSEGYQQEFWSGDGEQLQVEDRTLGAQTKIGAPADTAEVRMIREELALYGRQNPEIDAIYLLLKVENEERMAYTVLLDTHAPECRKHFEKIYEAIWHYAVVVPLIDFIIKGQIPAIDSVLNEKSLVYQK